MPNDMDETVWWRGSLFDVAVIGGGINGLAIAREAALQGLKVILFEQADIGFGASSKTSKLAHGGLRYLEQGDFPVVLQSLKARRELLHSAPHLVHPMSFYYPLYEGMTKPLWMIRMGLTLYDWMDLRNPLPKHTCANTQTMLQQFHWLRHEGLQGGCQYYDAQMNDVRLNVEEMCSAKAAGATVMTYTTVKSISKDEEGNFIIECASPAFSIEGWIRARAVVSATGAWINPLIGDKPGEHATPSKGIHLVIPQIDPKHAFILHAPQDRRVFFLIPWQQMTLVGTTETPYTSDPADVSVNKEDREYLLTALRHYYPKWAGKVIAAFAGVRPLIPTNKKDLGAISRKAEIDERQPGVFNVSGGKYTTYLFLARQVVHKLAGTLGGRYRKQRSSNFTYGGDCKVLLNRDDTALEQLFEGAGISLVQARRLVQTYGSHVNILIERLRRIPEERRQICPHHPHLYVELAYAILHEQTLTPEDWFSRRTYIAYTSCGGRFCEEQTRAYLARWKGKSGSV